MKKNLFLFTALLLSSISIQAADWQTVETGIADLSLQVDKESYREYAPGEYLYAIKYKSGNNPERFAYLKSNAKDGTLGIIYTIEAEKDNYRPTAIFSNPRAFMKPIPQNSFLQFANHYALNVLPAELIAVQNQGKNTPETRNEEVKNLKPVNFIYEENSQENIEFSDIKDYIAFTGLQLAENWDPPKSGRNTQSIIIVSIGADGSLQNYMFAQPSGDDTTDRSIISAIEQSVPFAKFPKTFEKKEKADFQFVFTYDRFKKYVN